MCFVSALPYQPELAYKKLSQPGYDNELYVKLLFLKSKLVAALHMFCINIQNKTNQYKAQLLVRKGSIQMLLPAGMKSALHSMPAKALARSFSVSISTLMILGQTIGA